MGDDRAAVAARPAAEPHRLGQLVRGELDWIVMKALEKDRTRRYETANALAADVQRYLADEPVEAGPPSATYRFSKFARRNRVALAMIAVVAAALLWASSVSDLAGDPGDAGAGSRGRGRESGSNPIRSRDRWWESAAREKGQQLSC